MIDIKSMTMEEIGAALKAMGEPAFRAKQVFVWLHKGVTSFDQMSNLSKALREKLSAAYYITAPQVDREMWRMPMFRPSAWLTSSRKRRTLSRLSMGSPMPIKTMLEMGRPLSIWVKST